jgi:hypothetical protein
LQFKLGAWFEGACGFALVLALSQKRQTDLAPLAEPICTRAAIHLIGRVISLRSSPKISPIDWQALTTIQQNNFIPEPPPARDPITLTVCVTPHPSTTSRQHGFRRMVSVYMKKRIYFRSAL